MKAISLWQPWASAIAYGLKTIETRSWPTKYRGKIAIHAAKKWNDDLWKKHMGFCCYSNRYHKYMPLPPELPFGCIVAVAEVVDCVPVEETGVINNKSRFLEELLGDYTPGRYGWILKNVVKLTHPVPVIGRQGFFNADLDSELED